MNVTTTLGLAAAAFGVAMGLSPLLQVRHMVARGSSADISLPFLLVLLVGFVPGSPTAWLSETPP